MALFGHFNWGGWGGIATENFEKNLICALTYLKIQS